MPTMTHPSPELGYPTDGPGSLETPGTVTPADITPDTSVSLDGGASAGDAGEVLTGAAAESSFGTLDTYSAAEDEPVVAGDDRDLFGDDQPDAITSARAQVNAALDDADTERVAAAGGTGGPDDPERPTGGNGGNGDGHGEDGEGEDADEPEGEDTGGEQLYDGPAPLKVPENFGVAVNAAHQGRREVFSGSETLPDGSELRVGAKVMGDRDTGGYKDGRPIRGVRVVGDAFLAKDGKAVLKVEDLTVVFPYDTEDPELAALGRKQQDEDWGTSDVVARKTAEATIAAMEALRRPETTAGRRDHSAETSEQPDSVNEQTRDFITGILGAYPNMNQLTQAEGDEVADKILRSYLSSWGGRSFKDMRARIENVEMARKMLGGQSHQEIGAASGMAEYTVSSRLRSISSWLDGKPEWKLGMGRIRERLSEIIESKTRPLD